jgi:hypothetical protein
MFNIHLAVFTRDASHSEAQAISLVSEGARTFGWNVHSFYIAPHQKPANPAGSVLRIKYSGCPGSLLSLQH